MGNLGSRVSNMHSLLSWRGSSFGSSLSLEITTKLGFDRSRTAHRYYYLATNRLSCPETNKQEDGAGKIYSPVEQEKVQRAQDHQHFSRVFLYYQLLPRDWISWGALLVLLQWLPGSHSYTAHHLLCQLDKRYLPTGMYGKGSSK